jgi:hypothetical protein
MVSNLRRRSMFELPSSGGGDFVQCEAIQSPSTPQNGWIVLPQRNRDFSYIEIEISAVAGNNVFFATKNSSNTQATTPYCGGTNNGYTCTPTLTSQLSGVKTVYTCKKTSTSNASNFARLGGWNDGTFSRVNKYHSLKMYDSNDELIADYVFGYLKSTDETGAYDKLSGVFVAESGTDGFRRI